MKKSLAAWLSSEITRLGTTARKNAEECIESLEQFLPHGSGLDGEVKLDLDASESNKLVINFDFHHMDEHGSYAGWSHGKIVVRPEFDGMSVKIFHKGVDDCADVRDDLRDTFDHALNTQLEFKFPERTFSRIDVG